MHGITDSRSRSARDWLTARGAELRERVRRVRDDLRRAREPLPHHSADAAVMLENDEILQAIENSALRELEQIEHALARLETGEFAICETCGEDIDAARLRIVPSTTLCGECARSRG